MRRLLVLAALLVALPAGAVEIKWVYVGDPGNPPDDAANCESVDCGSVDEPYYISKYEITNAQYMELLNAVADADPLELYNLSMGSNATFGGINRSGSPGSYLYAAKPGFENKPVVYVSFHDALRFANWLENGKPTGTEGAGTTEDGAYTITLEGIENNDILRNPGATFFLPSENQWYKAAYYDPALPGYYDYPARTGTPTACAAPGAAPNTANCESAVGALTDVGAYTASPSPWGTFDQGGNVREWSEQIVDTSNRSMRGGSKSGSADDLAAWRPYDEPADVEDDYVGFRVATLVPEPAQALLVLTGGLVLAAARRQRRA